MPGVQRPHQKASLMFSDRELCWEGWEGYLVLGRDPVMIGLGPLPSGALLVTSLVQI